MKRLWAVFAKKRIARELDDELRNHADLLAADYEKQGMPPEEARMAARRSMGNLSGMKEEYRDARGLPWVEMLLQNIRFAARLLWKNPGFTAVAVFALALGIGVNTAVFSITDVLLLRPLQIANLDRLVAIIGTVPGARLPAQSTSPGDFNDFRAQSRGVEHVAAWYQDDTNMSGNGEPQRIVAARVSTSFFDALQVQPVMGRLFHAAPDGSGLPHVALLSYGLWQTGFGGDSGITGKTVRLNAQPYEIVGVMGREFQYPPAAQMWIPMELDARDRANYDPMFLAVFGRLRPGVDAGQATAELNTIAAGIAQRHPHNHEHRGARVEPINASIGGADAKPIAAMLTVAVGFVLLLAAANVANLQLARVSLRAREIALRFAMGASRRRIVTQFLTESLMLSLAGAAAGVVVAEWATRMLRPMLPAEISKYVPGWERLGLNDHVMYFAVAVALAAGILSGIAPALFASRTHLEEALREGGRGAAGGSRRHVLRNIFVAVQMVLAMVLLVGAVAMVKGLRLMTEPAPHLDAAHALSMRVTLPASAYPDAAHQRIFAQRALDGVNTLPGVQVAALVRNLPYSGRFASESLQIAGHTTERDSVDAEYEAISPRYFEAMRVPILTGRPFRDGDDETGAGVAIVSESFARRWFPNGGALGGQIREGPSDPPNPWLTVVGIAANVRSNPVDFGSGDTVYRPIRQMPVDSFSAVLRATDPSGLAPAARAAIHAVDAALPVYEVMSLEKLFDIQGSPLRLIASLMGSFGLLALLLSSVGVYSIMAHSVSERKREIGVRVAMGAGRRQVVWMFLRQSLWLAGIGALIGAPAAYGLAKLLQGLFFGMRAADGAVFGLAVLVIASSSALASWSAARRAAGIDPITTLREE